MGAVDGAKYRDPNNTPTLAEITYSQSCSL